MESLIIELTEFTPLVNLNLDDNKFKINGESRPENANLFYTPILKWLDDYYNLLYWKKSKNESNNGKPLLFDFQFDYFNSTSAKFILDILMRLEKIHKEVTPITIRWIYEEPDVDMKDAGEEFEGIVSIPFEYIIEDF